MIKSAFHVVVSQLNDNSDDPITGKGQNIKFSYGIFLNKYRIIIKFQIKTFAWCDDKINSFLDSFDSEWLVQIRLFLVRLAKF